MIKRLIFLLIVLISTKSISAGDDFCGLRNNAFQQGESISYTIYYSVIGIYINAGAATFSVNTEKMLNKPVYHVIGSGTSNSRYDWIFKVRDQYESFTAR